MTPGFVMELIELVLLGITTAATLSIYRVVRSIAIQKGLDV